MKHFKSRRKTHATHCFNITIDYTLLQYKACSAIVMRKVFPYVRQISGNERHKRQTSLRSTKKHQRIIQSAPQGT